MMPDSLVAIAWIALCIAVFCALIIAVHVATHRQHMWIMNLVWPITALYSGPLGLWAYFRWGTLSTYQAMMEARHRGEKPPAQQKPFWKMVAVGATHCGSGCTLGDLIAEAFSIFVPLTLFGKPLFAGWVLDYVLALLLGIAFQYFTIKPMRDLSVGEGLRAAIKADFFSLTAWQVGMYGWMAIVVFAIFGRELPKTGPVFWFEMQIAMLCGYGTSYPVNWWLLRRGIKEKM
ncbi:MAG TPA: DUF4396 domain-containing protein [Opitutaceae bacterium]